MSSRPVESKDVVVGRILWLPPSDQLPADSVESVGQTPPIMKEAFDHPIVICSRPADRNGDWIHFHIVTSFHNKSLAERFSLGVKKQRRQLNWYLPIAPSEYHPHETESQFGRPHIELQNGRQMSSKSFINAKDIYAIQWRHLTHYQNRGAYRLTESSVKSMNERTGRLVFYIPGEQYIPEAASEPSSPEPSPPLKPSQAVHSVMSPVEHLPPVNKWTRVDVLAPFNLAGGNKAVVFVGTITSDNNNRSQALCIVPEQGLQAEPQSPPQPQPTAFSILAIPFRAVGQWFGSALSWMWRGCGRRKADTHIV